MALLQIAEPGESTAPHQHKLAIGIDFGTTNSLVATVRSGQADTLPDYNGKHRMPSVIRYLDDDIKYGVEALADQIIDPENTIISIKRFFGRTCDEMIEQYPTLPYHITPSQYQLPVFVTRQGEKNVVEITADLLTPLIERAALTLKGDIQGAVVTVPAYFDDTQRQVIKEAMKLLNLPLLRLINEPTAAAIAYGLENSKEGVIAVYDLGGGTFDISILNVKAGLFEVLSTGGNTLLGGDDFDNCLYQDIVKKLSFKDISSSLYRKILSEAKRIKELLTSEDTVQLSIDEHVLTYRRADFNALITDFVNDTLSVCHQALKDANVNIDEIMDIVMVGGSTRVPFVQEKVAHFFQKTPLTSIDPDRVVAIGASIQADFLIGNKQNNDLLLLDVLPLSLGIETMGGIVEKVISRNTTIPVTRAQEFTTYQDGQTSMLVHVVQGEREMVKDCRSLARFDLTDIPPMLAGTAVIKVTFEVNADGLLNVSAQEKTTGVSASVHVKPSFGLSDEEMIHMLESSILYAKEDIATRMLTEKRIDAERLLQMLNKALKDEGDALLTDNEIQTIRSKMEELEDVMNGQNGELIKQKIKELDVISEDFSAKRMDYAIRNALTGQTINNLDTTMK